MIHHRLVLNDVVAKVSGALVVVAPLEIVIEFIVELGQCGPLEIVVVAATGKMRGNGKGSRGRKTVDTCFLIWHRPEWFVELAVPVVRAVEWFEGNEFRGVRR